MTTALQQQVFAWDARYNAHRAPNNPNFKTLYIRRRSQLLRETERDQEIWKQYLKVRTQLLQRRYGSPLDTSGALPRTISRSSISNDANNVVGTVVPTKIATASRALVGGNTIAENYAFIGVHHIFDQHTKPVTVVKFANNDRSKLCCSSLDGNLSICCLTSTPPTVVVVLRGHSGAVTGIDWAANNDLIASSSTDGTVKLWSVNNHDCLRTSVDPTSAQILCCLFQPANNNLLFTGNNKGDVRIINVSTGRFSKHFSRVGGHILSLASDNNGNLVWVGNNRGEIISLACGIDGNLNRTHRIQLAENAMVTSLSYRAWISREARDPMLLVNCSFNALCLFRIIDQQGGLQMKRKFLNRHRKHPISSTFCPLMSFRQGACVVTGSEDGCVYFLDIEKPGSRACVNTLQGHASTVLGVSFNYDESLLATSDLDGLVIVWKRANVN